MKASSRQVATHIFSLLKKLSLFNVFLDVDYVPVSSSCGKILSKDIERNIRPNTCLVTVMLANNETGVIMPVSEISRS